MIEYIYFVKCMDCEDEPFDFFDEAKAFALSKLSQKPEIHQTEVVRNDFGECTDSTNYGKIWSWEDMMNDISKEDSTDSDFHIFTRGDFAKYADGYDPDTDSEFDDRDITFETDCVTCEHPLDEDYDKPVQIRTVKLPSVKGTIELNICVYKDEREYDYDDGEENYEIAVNGFINGEEFMLDNEKLSSLVRSGYTYLTHMLDEDAEETLEKLYKYFSEIEQDDIIDNYFSEIEQDDIIDNLLNLSDEYSYNFLKSLNESCRKPIPEGKTVKDLVEEMEENEDMVECKRCHELFPKEDMLYELTRGYLCPICIMDLDAAGEELEFRPREIPEKVVDEEPLEESKKRASTNYDIFEDSVSLYYNDLEATVQYNQTDADSWDEKYFYSDEFEYSIPMADFAEEVWNFCIDDESYKEFQERYEELYEDDAAWLKFVSDNAEELMRRYSTQLFDKFESDAEDKYRDEVWEEWNNGYLESVAEPAGDENLLETLEEPEEYKKKLMMCPECGDYSLDQETGICINCGFIAFD